jgi:HD-like signal output (HDOD) protein
MAPGCMISVSGCVALRMEGHMLKPPSKHDIEIRRYELLLEDILATAEGLPPFPDIIWKVMPLLQKMAPVSEIEAVIKYDQAITARVLALSQSAYY